MLQIGIPPGFLKVRTKFFFGTSKKIRSKVSTNGLDSPNTEKTETESIRVSRELLHTLRDRSRGEGMVWERGDRGGLFVIVRR